MALGSWNGVSGWEGLKRPIDRPLSFIRTSKFDLRLNVLKFKSPFVAQNVLSMTERQTVEAEPLTQRQKHIARHDRVDRQTDIQTLRQWRANLSLKRQKHIASKNNGI